MPKYDIIRNDMYQGQLNDISILAKFDSREVSDDIKLNVDSLFNSGSLPKTVMKSDAHFVLSNNGSDFNCYTGLCSLSSQSKLSN